jgi:hypothetical protein
MTSLTFPATGKTAAILTLGLVSCITEPVRAGESLTVDYRYAPPEWQTAICLPDDPQKTLVDRSGELLYHYNEGGREFGTRVSVTLEGAVWQDQELFSPQVPIVKTRYSGNGFQMIQEAFAMTDLKQPAQAPDEIRRLDNGGINLNWASPPASQDPALKHIAVHFGGSIEFQVKVPRDAARKIALEFCEGWWKEPGKRVQVLHVEGSGPKTVDTIADVGVNKAGAFWFDGRDTDGDGWIRITIDTAPTSFDKNTILNGLWVLETQSREDSESLLQGRPGSLKAIRWNAMNPNGPSRNDCILTHITNTGPKPITLTPQVRVNTTLPHTLVNSQPVFNGHEHLTSSLQIESFGKEDASTQLYNLPPITIPPGKTQSFVVTYHNGSVTLPGPATPGEAIRCRNKAVAYWHKAPIPFGAITLPDPGINALVQTSIRNIWQAREIKNGHPVFQVGPTCYRGLWIVDGAFLLESAAIVGAGMDARDAIAYTLSKQKPNGAFEVLSPTYYKENGIVLWTCVRHAMLTQDKAWLESVWPQLEKTCDYIKLLRQKSLENNTPLDDGINPPGNIDGGLWGEVDGKSVPEFSNVHWNLLGLRAFIQAAHWLNKEDTAKRWSAEYDSLDAAFRKAANRDLQHDPHGNAYVPIYMDNINHELPQRAQWTFCQAVYPGQIFDKQDPLVRSTLAMLQATEREGMVYGTGWDATGLWNYFASFYGHAWLWQGNGGKAAQILYAFANHAAPTGVWREEQSLKGQPFKKVGDMPHNWASAEFIRLAVHLVALDRGTELHLLEGYPQEWTRKDSITRLKNVATPFGPLTLTVKSDGKTVCVTVRPLKSNCTAIVVHLPGGKLLNMDPLRGGTITYLASPIPD